MRICKVCGQPYATSGYKYCENCKDKAYQALAEYHKKKNRREVRTICMDCGGSIEKPYKNRRRCFACQIQANKESKQRYEDKQKEKKASRYRPFYIVKSEFGSGSRMPSITEATRKAKELGISYAEYIAICKEENNHDSRNN